MATEDEASNAEHIPEQNGHPKQRRRSVLESGRRKRSDRHEPSFATSSRRKRRRNALKHGLSIPITNLPYFQKTIAQWHAAILQDLKETVQISDDVNAIAFEVAVQQCELVRIAVIRQAITAHPEIHQKSFSDKDIIHLITVIEGFVVEPHSSPIPFDTRAMSMLYRIFGIRTSTRQGAMPEPNFTPYQIRSLASLERYETRARSRLRKAIKRLKVFTAPQMSI